MLKREERGLDEIEKHRDEREKRDLDVRERERERE